MKTNALILGVICCVSWSVTRASATVIFDWATVGDPGNAPDQPYPFTNNQRFGAVDYTYRISKHEVTNDQYAEFLNNVAASDPKGLFNSRMKITQSGSDGSSTYTAMAGFERHPVWVVSFFDAMRFVNWLENGQPMGAQGPSTTEAGVYTIGTGVSETRALGATFFIPNEDEWYKAAYYDPRSAAAGGPPGDDNYWLYPTQNDTVPAADSPPGGTNSGNFALAETTAVGAYRDSTSFYGTFDQGGNVLEWNEAVVYSAGINRRGLRGGSTFVVEGGSESAASRRGFEDAAFEFEDFGFRVASIPEPSSLLLVVLGAMGLLLQRRSQRE